MAAPPTSLVERLKKAADGDKDALEFFGLRDGFQYPCPSAFSAATSSKLDLKQALQDAICFAEAANRLHLDSAEKVARSAIQHMVHSYFCLFDKVPKVVSAVFDGKDLALELVQNINQMQKSMEILKEVEQSPSPKGTAQESRAASPRPKPPTRNRKISTSSSSTEGSKYRPGGGDSTSSEESSERPAAKKIPPPKKLPAVKQSPSPKKSSIALSSATPAAGASPAPSLAAAAASSASAPPSAVKSKSPSKRSHHEKIPCPIPDCQFCGTDLRRHLGVHIKKGELAEEFIRQILNIARAGDHQFRSQIDRKGKKPLKGKPRKWCPVPLCNAIIIDVGRHLANPSTHGIAKNTREYQRLLRMAKPYTGLAEMEGNLAAPAPNIMEQRQESFATSPLSAHPHATEEDAGTQRPTASVGPSSASDSAEGKDSSSKPLLASAPASTAADSRPRRDSAATPSAAAPGSPESSHQGPHPSTPCASEHPDEASEANEDDDGEDDAALPLSSVQYFSAAKPKTNRHRWLVQFYQYLTRPTAGDKKKSARFQHAAQMRMLLEAINPGGDDITCLLANEGDVVWSSWVKPHLEAGTKKPGTLVSYLASYEKFLSFVTHERFNKTAPAIHPNHLPTFATILKNLKGWRSVVDAQSYEVKNKRMVDETEGLLTLEELEGIKASSHYHEAVRLCIQAGRGKMLTLTEFIMVRDLLLTRFSLDTGTRLGPLNNATMDEYGKGKVKDECKVMLVAKHKRAKDGPAICPMLPSLYKLMSIYVRHIRPHFPQPDVEALFVTSDGVAFREGTIGKRLPVFVSKKKEKKFFSSVGLEPWPSRSCHSLV